ncbi:MAG TPA: hypothetical protein VJQ56_06305 [Blastocatellia bacterium]|nr:hypothetical protein [Blastocatellia bacterium]
MFRTKILALFLLALTGFTACKGEAPPAEVYEAGDKFIERLKKGEYDIIYSDASDLLKEKLTRVAAIEEMKKIAAVGRIQDYKRTNMSVGVENGKSFASPVYGVAFENSSGQSSGQLTLQFVDVGGNWKLSGFGATTRGGRQAPPSPVPTPQS